MNSIKSAPRRGRTNRGTQRSINSMTNSTINSGLGEAYFTNNNPVQPRRAELYLVICDPKRGDDQAALAVPASLVAKLWPETAETLTALEGRLRGFGL